MAIPEDISLNDIDTSFLGVLNKAWPHSRDAARIVDGSGDEELPVAIDDEGTAVVGDIGGETQRKEEEEEEAKCKEGEREPHCIAHLLLQAVC